jgi:hypothetical protein
MSLGILSPARPFVEPRSPLVRVDAPAARLRKARFDLRQPLLGKQPPLFRLSRTGQPDAPLLVELGNPLARTLRSLLRFGGPQTRLLSPLDEPLLPDDVIPHRQPHLDMP